MSNLHPQMSRRGLIKTGALLTTSIAAANLLAACGGSTPSTGESASQTIRFLNYPGWIGKNEVALFEKQNPGVRIKQIAGGVSGSAQIISQIANDAAAYDMALLPGPVGGAVDAANLLRMVDEKDVPALATVPQEFRDAYPWGIPTDYGITGIGYRKDLVSEPIRGWADLIRIAPKYSGRIVVSDYADDVMGAALIACGYKVNDEDPGHLQEATDLLIELKPHIGSVLGTDITKPLVGNDPRAVISIDHDFSVAFSQRSDPNIVFVAPEEGIPAYIEGWGIIAGERNVDLITDFMDFHLQPKNYADFITATGSRSMIEEANAFLDPAVVDVQAFDIPADAFERFQYTRYVSPSYLATVNAQFLKFKNA